MPVVVQPAFRVEVLALEVQRVVDCSDVEAGDFAVGAERTLGASAFAVVIGFVGLLFL